MDIQTYFRVSQEITARLVPHELVFIKPAQTSRNILVQHRIHYVVFEGPNGFGIGEYAPIEGLSLETPDTLQTVFDEWTQSANRCDWNYWRAKSSAFVFAIETAFDTYINGWKHAFSPIAINGLVWMSAIEAMRSEAHHKIQADFQCVKFKVGAHNFEEECNLLDSIRRQYPDSNLMIRLDANGAFSADEAMDKLTKLASFHVHSIEQPIRAGNQVAMAEICKQSPIPIALDEELIGVHERSSKRMLLETIRPQYIVLKPTLHGGKHGCDEWIELATELNIGWWVTSALESNIGLYGIACWLDSKSYSGYQGLGTGELYANNIDSPLKVEKGYLTHQPKQSWDFNLFQG